ncbi:hypothetical protein Tco_1063305, partial [Tanacetum coccineum]
MSYCSTAVECVFIKGRGCEVVEVFNPCACCASYVSEFPKQSQPLKILGALTKSLQLLDLLLSLKKVEDCQERPNIQKTSIIPNVIKLDATLGNLKFANKGTTYLVFRMAILMVMLNDDIKASVEYSEYLAKSKGSNPVKTRGKGLLTKQGVKIVVERVSIPKRRRSEIVVEEVGQSEEVVDEVDSDETEYDEEEPLVRRRPTGVVIGGEARRESDEEG